MMKSILFLSLSCLYLLTSPAPALAEQTSSCHCFRVRSYDPANKFAADDYLLATSYNSLIAVTLDVSKRQIVMMKMKGGVDANDLLTALYIADKTDAPMDLLLSIRENGGSWQSILESPALQAKNSSDPVLAEITAGADDDAVSSLITDTIINTYYHAPAVEIKKLRDSGFANREINLLFALNRQSDTPLPELVAMSRQQEMSWSEIAHNLKLTPAGIGKAILANQR
jgi:hypothetical protein